VNADGTGLRKLSDRVGYGPDWSPGGERIAFTGYAEPSGEALDIYVVEADDTGNDGSPLRAAARGGRRTDARLRSSTA